LGSSLVRAAKESDSSLADLITTQKQTIEQEKKAQFRKILGKKTTQRKNFHKKREHPQKKDVSGKPGVSNASNVVD
jgi:hypothetical protein